MNPEQFSPQNPFGAGDLSDDEMTDKETQGYGNRSNNKELHYWWQSDCQKKGHYDSNDKLVDNIDRIGVGRHPFQQTALVVESLLEKIKQGDDNTQAGEG